MNAMPKRRGYAMVLVLVFIALMLSVYSVAYRHVAAAVRIEKVRTQLRQRNEGSVEALAQALTALETGLPPSDPYVCATAVETTTGTRSFTVTFTSQPGDSWSVHVAPTDPMDDPPPMPARFD